MTIIDLEGASERVVISAGTGGVHGLNDAAFAIIESSTISRSNEQCLDALPAFAEKDSGTALETSGDTIHTGPTGTNVCDLAMVAVDRP